MAIGWSGSLITSIDYLLTVSAHVPGVLVVNSTSIVMFFAALIFPVLLVSIAGQPLGDADQTDISITRQTVKDQKTEIAQVGEFWTSLLADFTYEGIAQAMQECQEKLGTKCSSEILKQIGACVMSSSANADFTNALSTFVKPLQSELDAITIHLNDPSPDMKVIEKDVWTMNLTRTDTDSFVYRKNKAQSEFIVNVNPIVDSIPAVATKCLGLLSA